MYLLVDKWRFIKFWKSKSGEELKNEMRVAGISGLEEFLGDLREKYYFLVQKNIQKKM